ncbi:sensor histidine kinase [Agromyces atrinae]|uniref:Signal transduction histidine kinase n=1 Tax=Agromyces atrinae TaxID=592376 RepID=A0A4Q2M5Y7_9MICO|nr:ATP-binding protein [Agromyces atrinae]NYD66729.1 signal transduction histidine kinase [Agromyces atrinae]RXZ87389.1 hypothetical protein ESP50_05580 [Agromyces atrinae]
MTRTETHLGHEVPRPRSSVSSAQIETIAARALGLFGLVFGAQTVPIFLDQIPAMAPAASIVTAAVVIGTILVLAVTSVIAVGARIVSAVFAGVYAAVIVTWPLIVVNPEALDGQIPWPYFLCTVATTAACVAFSLRWAVTYAVLVPVAYSIVRVSPEGGNASTILAVFDGLYAFILGIVVIIIITMLRQASAAVDAAQEAALRRYDLAVRQHASEVERVRVDALVHDSVLTTLLSAAAAESPEQKALASRMAGDAILRLDEAGAAPAETVETAPLPVLVRRVSAALATFAPDFEVDVESVDGVELPVDAVEAIYSATVQAMVNSMQHAGPGRVSRSLLIRGERRGGCLVSIVDTGRGFDPADVPSARLGLRVSIVERVQSAGGSTVIRSAPGEGTSVTIHWPAEEAIA